MDSPRNARQTFREKGNNFMPAAQNFGAKAGMLFRFVLLLCAAAKLMAAGPPNILLAIADDWGLHAGAYGARWVKTPAFDRVAREGLLFQRAYTPNAKCAPSRACILTGRNPWQLKEAANHICYFPPEFKTWCEVLTEKGWHTGHTTKGWGPGVALDGAGKQRLMTGKPWNALRLEPDTSGIGSCDYAGNFSAFLDTAPADKSWCFWYGCIEPHRGYEKGSGIKKGGKSISDINRVPAYWPDNETVRSDMLDYALEVEHFDRHLGRMLAELEKRGQLDNTIIVITSDHSMPFPRHKGNVYEFSCHVPLAVRWPGGIKNAGRKVEEFVSFIDLAPTLMEVAGIPWKQTGMAPAQGTSLANIFAGEKDPQRDRVLLGRERNDIGRPNDAGYPVRAIATQDWLYMENLEPSRWPAGNPETGYLDCDGGATKTLLLESRREDATDKFWAFCFGMRPAREFYNLKTDPDCLTNLALLSFTPPEIAALQDRLRKELKDQGDPRSRGEGDQFDRYLHAHAVNRGFYEKQQSGRRPATGWINPADIEPAPVPANQAP